MYERFTDRARKVMQLANQEAQRWNHEYVGTEHIFIALVSEGSGLASAVLKHLGLTVLKLRQEVENFVQSGPEMITMDKLPHTPRSKKVIEYAIEEARSLNHNVVGTEHLLLGLIREPAGVAMDILKSLDIKVEAIRQEILHLLGVGTSVAANGQEFDIVVIKEHDGFAVNITSSSKKIRVSFDDGESVEGLITVFEALGLKATYEEAM